MITSLGRQRQGSLKIASQHCESYLFEELVETGQGASFSVFNTLGSGWMVLPINLCKNMVHLEKQAIYIFHV